MEQDKDLFNFIRQFKYICQTMYDTEVNVEIVTTEHKPKYHAEDLISIVQDIFKKDVYIHEPIRMMGLRNKSRKREVITYRQCIGVILRDRDYSLTYIGNCLNQDHATVFHGIKCIKNLLQTKDPLTIRIFNRIKDELKKEHNIDIYPPRDTKPEADA